MSVIVIGAGIAGLTAALTCAQAGLAVTVLEGRARLGGRVFTTTHPGSPPIERGVSFWEGKDTTPFYQHYFKNGLAKVKRLRFSDSSVFVNNILRTEVLKHFPNALTTLMQANIESDCRYQGLSHAQIIDLLSKNKSYWLKVWLQYLLTHHNTPLTQQGIPRILRPKDPDDLESWNDHDAHISFIQNGAEQIVHQLQQACLQHGVTIFTQQQVLKIIDNNLLGACVQTNLQQHYAKKIICTIPIGVLQKTADKLFVPALSIAKKDAVSQLGIHCATRVILQFEQPFWENNHGPYLFLIKTQNQQSDLKEFRNLFALHQQAILQTDSYSAAALELTNELLIAKIMQDLTENFPNATLPIATEVVRWSEDPFAYGAYPYRTAHLTEAQQQALTQPEGNIYFAGADFSRLGFSMHNAYHNAQQVANTVLLHSI